MSLFVFRMIYCFLDNPKKKFDLLEIILMLFLKTSSIIMLVMGDLNIMKYYVTWAQIFADLEH